MAKQDMYLIDIVGKYERLVTLQTLDNMIAKALADGKMHLYHSLLIERGKILARK